ncbi:nodulation protein NfeD [Myxococcota bacterium]|nr:nodulation protein NfeD [Myxococcota bacterium]
MIGRLTLLGLIALLGLAAEPSTAGEILLVEIDGSINPASADYLIGAIHQAEETGAAAVLIELDTPGGLVSSTQDIIQAMLNSSVPTIVFVSPRGATATSAGTFITLAANVAAMMPGTSIGAAHPVSLFGGSPPPAQQGEDDEAARAAQDIVGQKMENYLAAYVESIAKQRGRNVEWAQEAVRTSQAVTSEKALELGVIDLVATSRAELLEVIEGREIEVGDAKQRLSLAGHVVVPVEQTLVQAIFDFLTDPNLAFILFAIGALGLYMEFQHPGLIVPGAVGVVALVLLGFSMQILPFSWVGAMLVLVGVALLVAEIFVVSFGLLFVAGLACFLIGGTMVFDRPEASDLTVSFWEVLVPIAGAMTAIGALMAFALGRSILSRQTAGVDQMIGLVGRVEAPIGSGPGRRGKVFVHGEYWNAEADEAIAAGESVSIEGVEGLTVRVRRVDRVERDRVR